MHNINLASPINRNNSLNVGLLAWWKVLPKLSGGNTFYDLMRIYNGTLENMSPETDWISTGERQALDFDGTNDYIDIGSASGLALTNTDFTISVWFKWDSSDTNDNVGIVSKYASSTSNRGWLLGTGDAPTDTQGSLKLIYQSSTSPFNSDEQLSTGTSTFDDGIWHNLIVTFVISTKVEIYVDGTPIASKFTDVPASVASNSATVSIARHNNDTSSTFAGQLDDVRIYNRALSDEEVAEYYRLSSSGYPGLFNHNVSIFASSLITEIPSGGVLVGGLARVAKIQDGTVSGGVLLGETVDSFNVILNPTTNNGILVGGTAKVGPNTVLSSIGTSSRDFSTITAWEATFDDTGIYSSGDIAIGEMYNDSIFDENVTINGGGTVGLSQIILRAASGEKHTGVAGTGVRIVKTTNVGNIVAVLHSTAITTNVEDIEIDGNGGGHNVIFSASSIGASSVTNLQRCILHNLNRVATGVNSSGLFKANAATLNASNNIIYKITRTSNSGSIAGIRIGDSSGTTVLYNNTVHNVRLTGVTDNNNFAYGANLAGDNVNRTYKNNIITDTTNEADANDAVDWNFPSGTSLIDEDYNAASDTSISAANDLQNVVSSDLFVSTVEGSEDLHLNFAVAVIGEGVDLGNSPSGIELDIDSFDRHTANVVWDMGADQFKPIGGLLLGGEAQNSVSKTVIPSGGVIVSGTFESLVTNVITGGIITGGQANVYKTFTKEVKGGVLIGGLTSNFKAFTAIITGGIVISEITVFVEFIKKFEFSPFDTRFLLSGGPINGDPLLSLGGEPSFVESETNLFEDFTPEKSSNGLEDYRCIYIFNNLNNPIEDFRMWVENPTLSPATILLGIEESDDIQEVNLEFFSGVGSFTLDFDGNDIKVIADSDLSIFSQNFQDSLRNNTILTDVTVTAQLLGNSVNFLISFVGEDGKRNQPTLSLKENGLAGSPTVSIAKTVIGSPINAIAETISESTTAPIKPTFRETTETLPISFSLLDQNEGFPLWIKRTIPVNPFPTENDGFFLKILSQEVIITE